MEAKEVGQRVNILTVDGSYLVWDAEGAFRLRTKHRILGNLIGCLPTEHATQVIISGLPMSLSAEEALLAQQQNIANILYDQDPYVKPSAEDVAAFNRSREEFLERNQPKDKPPIGLVTIPTANVLPPLQPMKHYDAPASALTTAKYRIYKDLWSKGLFVMTGNRFHVDFVIYKGDPLVEHAVSYVAVRDWDEGFSALDLVSHSRLAKTIQKTFVLAAVDPTSDSVKYLTINWEGVS